VSSLGDKIRSAIILALLLAGFGLFAYLGHEHYPIQKWMFWRYAGYWVACAAFSLCCVSLGHLVVTKLLRHTLPVAEHLSTSFMLGVFGFFLAMFVAGVLQLYGTVLFFVLPVLLFAPGAPSLWRYLRRLRRHVRAHQKTREPRPLWHYAVMLFGLGGLLMVYFVILHPEHAQFDARWKHLALAEEYWASGGIRRFPEGWTVATYHHLVSYLFTWGFMVPGGELFDQVEMCAHMEMTIFIWMLPGIVGLTRLCVPRSHADLAWGARFLFPGVFLYDSSLATGADHIGAAFAIPIFTLMFRAYGQLRPAYCAMLATMMAGAALVKYTSAILLFPIPAAVVAVRAVWLAVKQKTLPEAIRRNWYKGPLTALGVGLAVTAPHWLKNVIWYTDPLYPMLHKHLALRPWIGQDGATVFEAGYKDHQFWRPERNWEGLKETFGALFNFSFEPNDYKRYHRDVPVFGSLFTLMLGPLLAVRVRPHGRQRVRLWAVIAGVHIAVFIWYWTHHQDRYLQTLVPLMAVCTGASIILLWRSGWPARIGVVLLVGLQIVWGGDVYFIQSHAMIKSPIKKVNDLLQMGHQRKYDQRFAVFGSYQKMRKVLPEGARVLLHDNHTHVGVGRETVNDWQGWQYGMNYGRLKSPKEVDDLLRRMGATHVVWVPNQSKGWDSLAGDIMFFHYATTYVEKPRRVGRHRLGAMPKTPPPDEMDDTVAIIGCKKRYPTGLYRVSQLTVPVFGPARHTYPEPILSAPDNAAGHKKLVTHAAFVGVDTNCKGRLPAEAAAKFTKIATRRREEDRKTHGRKAMDIYKRRTGTVEPLP